MFSIITGTLIISLLHAIIPNHWLPVIAIGKNESWSINEVTKVTFVSAIAHALSTIFIGAILSVFGAELAVHLDQFTHLIAPCILITLGFIFIYRHHRHKHFKIENGTKKTASKGKIITALVVAMFFSPCLEIEAYFLLAGAESKWLVWLIAGMYFAITTTGMVILVRFAYSGLLKVNSHSLEHNAGIITGLTLLATGIITYFIN